MDHPNAPIVAVGECMLELSRTGAGGWQLGAGGDVYNTSVYLARQGRRVAFLTALGEDPFSAELRRSWAEEGLDCSLVLTEPGAVPGLYAIRTGDGGERHFYYWRKDAPVRRLFALPGIEQVLAAAAAARLLYLSGITVSLFGEADRGRLLALAEAVRRAGNGVAFDPNYRPGGWSSPGAAQQALEPFYDVATMLFPTWSDEALLWGDADAAATVDRLRAGAGREVIVKLGAEGCLIGGNRPVAVPASLVADPLDTTAAGDSFNAGYIAARLDGREQAAAAAEGHALAAEVIRWPGAIVPRQPAISN